MHKEVGSDMVTIQELSKKCGVSISTVSKALNGYSDISDKTREIIIKTANEMGYYPNTTTKAYKLKRTYNIGVLFHTYTDLGLKNDYFAHILSAFKDETSKNGYDITFIENFIGGRKLTLLEHCKYRNFDGICIVCANYKNEEVIKLVNSDFPVVTIDYSFPNTYSIISDNYNGMKQLTNYIINQGHRNIAFICGIKNNLVTESRINGYYDALRENNINLPEDYLLEGRYRNYPMSEELALRLLQHKVRPTCIIAPDDLSATGVLSAIRKRGLQPVKDVSMAGYDRMDANLFIGAKLTTVCQEREFIGKEAAKKLVQMIENKHNTDFSTVYIKQSLVIGNSVRKIR